MPHHFDRIEALADKTILLSLDGSVSNMFTLTDTVSDQFREMFDLYPVEASTNLADWTRLALLLRTNSDPNPLVVRDTNARGLSQRFYCTPSNHLVTAFPKPTGPFGVGTFSRILADPSRSNRYGIATNCSFMSTFWYPAEPPGTGSLPCAYTDRAVAADGSFYMFWHFPDQWTSAVPYFVAHAISDAPVLAGSNRFPVVVHSHGFTCDRRFNSQVAEELASHGYIVAAVDHEDCHATVFPDARGTQFVPPGSRMDQVNLLPSRINDLQRLLAELGQMELGDPVLSGRVDLERLGVMGFSAGGGVAAETCRVDSRVKCTVILDGYINFTLLPLLNSQGLQKPFLAMNRTLADGLPDYSPAAQRLYTLARANATWLKIRDTMHFGFSDFAWSVQLTNTSRPGAVAMDACLLWFFDTYLKGQSPPFPTNPELINVQRK